jgi:septal ring factor EnvC (AmiA/AmiB activator)
MPDLSTLATLVATAIGSGGLGAVAQAHYRTRRSQSRDEIDAARVRAEAEAQRLANDQRMRDELWRELSTVRSELGQVKAQVAALQGERAQLLTDCAMLRISHERVTQELREKTEECDAVTAERDALQRMLNDRSSGVSRR